MTQAQKRAAEKHEKGGNGAHRKNVSASYFTKDAAFGKEAFSVAI